jgi:hypothetical protein
MKNLLIHASVAFVVPIIAVLVIALALPGSAAPVRAIELAPMSAMPDYVHGAHAAAQHAYRFATANPELVSQFPCYCGCVYIGHTNNYDCYIQKVETDGTFVFDQHAVGCGICVEITNDVARLWGDGAEIEAIQDFIVATYSHRGPST